MLIGYSYSWLFPFKALFITMSSLEWFQLTCNGCSQAHIVGFWWWSLCCCFLIQGYAATWKFYPIIFYICPLSFPFPLITEIFWTLVGHFSICNHVFPYRFIAIFSYGCCSAQHCLYLSASPTPLFSFWATLLWRLWNSPVFLSIWGNFSFLLLVAHDSFQARSFRL